MEVAVVSWNILSESLCDPSYFTQCLSKYLETEYRWNRIKFYLFHQIQKNAIICLQELTDEWIEKLLLFFLLNNYQFVYDSGQHLSTGIAYPQNKYILEKIKFVNVGDYIYKLGSQNGTIKHGWLYKIMSAFVKILKRNVYEDPWVLAMKRKNRIVGIKVKDKASKIDFYVFTYHFPCMFYNLPVMNIHALAICNIMETESKQTPYIIAGDFNSKQNSDVYSIMRYGALRGTLPKSSIFKTDPTFEKFVGLVCPHEILKKTPLLTCCSYNSRQKTLFKDTIDWIFHSLNFRVIDVLPMNEKIYNAIPDENEPSDHLMIGCTLVL
jgi:endonuclease/exonuclease/phosphatase family metal-dependent hydrolase